MCCLLNIDFVSDVSCPWCAIGLRSLQRALSDLDGKAAGIIRFRPFELNPRMPPGGQNLAEHMSQKYGSTPDQQLQLQEVIRQRGEAVGFTFRWERNKRIYNTFDAHRLLHWAGLPEHHSAGTALVLKQALLEAYFTRGESPESHAVLLRVVKDVGLDEEQARSILESSIYADDVRTLEKRYMDAGIHSVPAVIVNNTYLISGGQAVNVYRQMLENVIEGRREFLQGGK